METTAYRYRLTFGKEERIRFTGHLDIHRAWERTFRRAGLPLAYRQGFNPRPRLNIGSALPLGHSSTAELMDFWLEEELDTKTIAMRYTFVFGLIAGLLGIRAIQPLMDPMALRGLSGVQRAWFSGLDIIVTGTLLGGGSKGIHEIMEAILNSVERFRGFIKP